MKNYRKTLAHLWADVQACYVNIYSLFNSMQQCLKYQQKNAHNPIIFVILGPIFMDKNFLFNPVSEFREVKKRLTHTQMDEQTKDLMCLLYTILYKYNMILFFLSIYMAQISKEG